MRGVVPLGRLLTARIRFRHLPTVTVCRLRFQPVAAASCAGPRTWLSQGFSASKSP
jgi:hypothetical protein